MSKYLGKKGYTILKKHLSTIEQERIRKDLTVSPRSNGPSYGVPPSFPIYRESAKKMYIPQSYGLEHYGPPEMTVHAGGEAASLSFAGTLRQDQKDAALKYLSKTEGGGGGLLELYCGFGKTVVALWIAAKLGLRTIIIVHKDFLVSQWRERIQQFLPGATIGKLQGPHLDVDGCDIVIAMLQSLSTKNYSDTLWDGFGLTIVDECHHMSAEVFSNALFKVVTPYMLGLSATMTRKDGLSKVFKMFLGDVVAKKRRSPHDGVVVMCHRFRDNDPEFGATELDFRGQIKYAAMVNKVHSFGPRISYVIKIIMDVVNSESSDRQALVLAQNRQLLVDIMMSLEARSISAGFYVGGMKDKDLQVSAEKRVILATYGMAEEALDIKGLTTLVLASPRTSIEQAVGRILRIEGNSPVVHDIVDQHDVFQRQWKKRLTFYNKGSYTVKEGTVGGNASTAPTPSANGLCSGVCYV
jgi:superfamily II DNA or RNA helicase